MPAANNANTPPSIGTEPGGGGGGGGGGAWQNATVDPATKATVNTNMIKYLFVINSTVLEFQI